MGKNFGQATPAAPRGSSVVLLPFGPDTVCRAPLRRTHPKLGSMIPQAVRAVNFGQEEWVRVSKIRPKACCTRSGFFLIFVLEGIIVWIVLDGDILDEDSDKDGNYNYSCSQD